MSIFSTSYNFSNGCKEINYRRIEKILNILRQYFCSEYYHKYLLTGLVKMLDVSLLQGFRHFTLLITPVHRIQDLPMVRVTLIVKLALLRNFISEFFIGNELGNASNIHLDIIGWESSHEIEAGVHDGLIGFHFILFTNKKITSVFGNLCKRSKVSFKDNQRNC